MAKTVNAAFSVFNRDFVNLDPDRTKIARSSRDWLIGQLVNLPEKIGDFPKLYDGLHIKFGSFARNTKIRPLDDIDLFLAFSAEGTTYFKNGNSFPLTVPEGSTNLRKLCNDDGTLNSIKVVNKIVASLGKIEHYKGAEKHRKQEAATLQLSSYEWNFDIVPAFYTDTGHYVIADGQGGWQGTDPRIDQKRIDQINQNHDGKALQVIRTLRYWNERAMMTTIPSYLFENIILNFLDGQEPISDYIDYTLRHFWNYLSTAIYYQVNDPKGFQGNLNTLTREQILNISAKAKDANNKAIEAYTFELEERNQQKAINKWREIFGDNFPKYE